MAVMGEEDIAVLEGHEEEPAEEEEGAKEEEEAEEEAMDDDDVDVTDAKLWEVLSPLRQEFRAWQVERKRGRRMLAEERTWRAEEVCMEEEEYRGGRQE
jgi:hypothetical protein